MMPLGSESKPKVQGGALTTQPDERAILGIIRSPSFFAKRKYLQFSSHFLNCFSAKQHLQGNSEYIR